ncbi:MAG: xanthine dehydrogenase family protein molybdopterin-binding subunit [Chloroflexota bacterium]
MALSTRDPGILATPDYRLEGPQKVTGRAAYSADISIRGMLHAKTLGSPHAHALIRGIDVSAARALPGVAAVITAYDIGPIRTGRRLMDYPILAWERVRFVGERVAAVAAESLEIAEEALGLIHVDYQELPAALTPAEALADGAPVLHPDISSYQFRQGSRDPVPHANMQAYKIVGKGSASEIEAAFAGAAHVFEHTFRTPRQHAGYIEPRVALVWIDADETVRVVTTNKLPFNIQEELSMVTGLPLEKIDIDCGFVGGDFGGKGLSLDEMTGYFLALRTGRPIKTVLSYGEELTSTNSRHAATIRLRTAVDSEGRFLAHEGRMLWDGGAYAAGKPQADVNLISGSRHFNAYRIPLVRSEHVMVYTNNVPGGQVRGPGNAQVVFAWESHVDMMAAELGLDPLELRERNALNHGDSGMGGQRIADPRSREVLDAVRREFHWNRPLPAHHGRGLAFFTRETGEGKTSIIMRIATDGRVEVVTGVPEQGSGIHTMVARVTAAALDIDPLDVLVTRGTTTHAPWDPGVAATRSTHLIGQAVLHGAAQLRPTLEALAAELLGWPAGQVTLHDGEFHRADNSAEFATFAEVARRIGEGPTVEVAGFYDSAQAHHADGLALNFLATAFEVQVDPETGQVTIIDALMVTDVGAIINPIGHEGQVEGGFVCGLGSALLEELVADNGRIVNGSLADYKLPNIADLPAFRSILIRGNDGPGPFGAKAIGEHTNIGVPPALANAIAHAVGARVTDLPITPERVLRSVQN